MSNKSVSVKEVIYTLYIYSSRTIDITVDSKFTIYSTQIPQQQVEA